MKLPTQTARISKELKGHEAKHRGNVMSNFTTVVDRYVAAGVICVLALVGVFGGAAHAQTDGKEIARVRSQSDADGAWEIPE